MLTLLPKPKFDLNLLFSLATVPSSDICLTLLLSRLNCEPN